MRGPKSEAEYRNIEKRYVRITNVMFIYIFGGALSMIIFAYTPLRVAWGLLLLLIFFILFPLYVFFVIRYFVERHRQGFKLGYWQDLPRKNRRK